MIHRANYADKTLVDFNICSGDRKMCTDGIQGRIVLQGEKEFFTGKPVELNFINYEELNIQAPVMNFTLGNLGKMFE
jgi:hypothetical protein